MLHELEIEEPITTIPNIHQNVNRCWKRWTHTTYGHTYLRRERYTYTKKTVYITYLYTYNIIYISYHKSIFAPFFGSLGLLKLVAMLTQIHVSKRVCWKIEWTKKQLVRKRRKIYNDNGFGTVFYRCLFIFYCALKKSTK